MGTCIEYIQSMFLSKNMRNRYTPAYPFCYIKVGFKGVYITRTCFPDDGRIPLMTFVTLFLLQYVEASEASSRRNILGSRRII